jgi:hypothetical protein
MGASMYTGGSTQTRSETLLCHDPLCYVGGLPFFWPSKRRLFWANFAQTSPMSASLVAQIQGAVRYKEGSQFLLTGEVFAKKNESFFEARGPPPTPWRLRRLLWFPRAGSASAALGWTLVEELAGGVFVAELGAAAFRVLSPFVLWSVSLDLDGVQCRASFFDCAGIMQRRSRRKEYDVPPLLPIPGWSERDIRPTLMAFRREDLEPIPDKPVPPPVGSAEAVKWGFLPALPLAVHQGPTPEEVRAEYRPVYNVVLIKERLRVKPFQDTSGSGLQQCVLDILENGSGDFRSFDQALDGHRREATNNKSSEPYQDDIQKIFMSFVKKNWMAGPYESVPYPNLVNDNQGIVTALGEASSDKWTFLALDALADDDLVLYQRVVEAIGVPKVRPTFDAKGPHDPLWGAWSINNNLRGDRLEQLYITVDDVVGALLEVGPGGYVLGFDVKKAFNTLLTKEKDLHAYIQYVTTKAFGKQYFVSLINTFGSTDSPPAWQLFANVVWWLFQTAPEAALRLLKIMLFYVDNFWGFLPLDVLGPCPEEKALEINSAVHDLLDRLNLPFHEDFCGQFFEGLGSAIGTVPAPFISFKPGKRTLSLAFMDWLPRQQSLSLKDLQRAKGFFTWIAATFQSSARSSRKSKPSKTRRPALVAP